MTKELEHSSRPWGRYQVLQESEHFKVKCIWVNPGGRLSYQRHKFRSEHWFFTQGSGIMTLNGVESRVEKGSSVEFGVGDLHRVANAGTDELIFVEVQTGSYFGEDDIERIEDDYAR